MRPTKGVLRKMQYPPGVHSIYDLQPRTRIPRNIPWNLSLERCREIVEDGRDLDLLINRSEETFPRQPFFDSLPVGLHKPFQHRWFPPVFHYGYVFDDDGSDKLKAVEAHNAATHPNLHADAWNVIMLMRSIFYTGYQRANAPLCLVEGTSRLDGLRRVFSVATNYNPWVEPTRMEKIDRLLGPALGKPKWMVDKRFTHWKLGRQMDYDVPIDFVPYPVRWYIGDLEPKEQDEIIASEREAERKRNP